jgi:homoserine O-acetyltransferase
MWAWRYPDFADGLVPLAAVPTAIVGRNRVWRRMLMDSIREDPAWKHGAYTEQPVLGLSGAARLSSIMGAAPLHWHALLPTRDKADEFAASQVRSRLPAADANDMLYQFDASRDYDPSPHLARIVAPVLAINSADDQINPPELGLMERLMPQVRRGRFVLIPTSEKTRGHGTHTWAALYREELRAFIAALPASPAAPAPTRSSPRANPAW